MLTPAWPCGRKRHSGGSGARRSRPSLLLLLACAIACLLRWWRLRRRGHLTSKSLPELADGPKPPTRSDSYNSNNGSFGVPATNYLLAQRRSSPVHLQVTIGRFKARNLPEVASGGALLRLLRPSSVASYGPLRLQLDWGGDQLLMTGGGADVAGGMATVGPRTVSVGPR